jgi:hypothetical protein
MLKIKVSAKTIKNYTRSSCLCFLAFDAPQLAAGSFTLAHGLLEGDGLLWPGLGSIVGLNVPNFLKHVVEPFQVG